MRLPHARRRPLGTSELDSEHEAGNRDRVLYPARGVPYLKVGIKVKTKSPKTHPLTNQGEGKNEGVMSANSILGPNYRTNRERRQRPDRRK